MFAPQWKLGHIAKFNIKFGGEQQLNPDCIFYLAKAYFAGVQTLAVGEAGGGGPLLIRCC